MTPMNFEEEYTFRRSTQTKFDERHLEKCLKAVYEKPSQQTSSEETPNCGERKGLRKILKKYHNSLYCLISIPLYLILGACIMSVIPSEIIPQIELTPKVVHSSMKDTL